MAAPVLTIDQGDDEVIHMTILSPLQADAPVPASWSATDTSTWGPLNLTGSKLWFTVRTNAGVEVLAKTTEVGAGITITNAAGGLADVTIDNLETAALDVALINKALRLEVQARSATGQITTLKRGSITILRDRQAAV